MTRDAAICVAGGRTFIGAAVLRRLGTLGYRNVVSEEESHCDLEDPLQVDALFARATPNHVFLVAGASGGIMANLKYPADLMRGNLLTAANVIGSAYRHGVQKLLYLASSCTYPRDCPQPMREDSLLTGPLEPSSEAYAVAKIAGIKLCQAYRRQYGANFISGIPADAFGPGDDFSREHSHVVAALLRKMHDAKARGSDTVEVWGTGTPRREFIFVDDLADACIFVMQAYDDPQPINLGGGTVLSIKELAGLIKEVVGYPGEVRFDPDKPDGAPSKVLDWERLGTLGWRPRTPLRAALEQTYQWFLTTAGGDAVYAR